MYIIVALLLLIYKYQDIPGRYLHKSTSLYCVSTHTHLYILTPWTGLFSFNLRQDPPNHIIESFHKTSDNPQKPTDFSSSERCLFPRQRKLISPAVGNVLLPVIRGEGSPMKHIVKNVDILNPQRITPWDEETRRFQVEDFSVTSGCCWSLAENQMKLSVKYVHMSQWKIVQQVLTLYVLFLTVC